MSFVGSAIFNLLVGLPLLRIVSDLLAAPPAPGPVRVVKLSAEQWSRNRHTTQPSNKPPAFAKSSRPTPSDSQLVPEAKKEEAKKEEPKKEEKLTGQIVEVPPTVDERQNPEAKYLSKYNSNVEKQSIARSEERDSKMKRVTNKLQTVEQQAIEQSATRTPNLTIKGDHGTGEKEGGKTDKVGETQQKFVLEMPDLQRRDNVRLKLGNEPGIGGSISNRTGSAAMKGNADELNVQLGDGTEDVSGENGGKQGSATGSEEKKLPTLAALLPTFGTVSRMSGSPSRDHVEGVPEGDGTFLNTKEFKYATFFYRVRDSVASYWEDLASNEYRRRDPTGNIYGIRDRSTMLQVRLSRDGKLSDVKVEQTSGVDFLDHVAVEAFQKAQPFPNPPPGIADEDGSIRFNFQFVVTMGSRSPLDYFQMK